MNRNLQLVFAILAVAICALVVLYKKTTRHLRLPPGPKPLPILNNLFDMPSSFQWKAYDKWFKSYGNICYFEGLGTRVILLGSWKMTSDIFHKRGAFYSDRIGTPMIKLMGWTGWNFGLMPYGPLWRVHRRSFEEHFRAGTVMRYQGVQLQLARALLKRLLNEPDDFMLHIRHSISAIIMRVVYGYQVKESNDPFLELAHEAAESAICAGFGNFLVDFIPWLRHVPQWFPGAGFQRKAAHWKYIIHTVIDRPWAFVKDTISDGTATSSIATMLLEGLPEGEARAEKELVAKNCASIAFMAGADTTISATQSFFLAMAMFPDVQKKAQAELDSVVGCERLPDFNDYDSLPYINAIVKEVLRWQPPIPTGIPHFSMKDDEYEGYFFPARTLIIGNVWSILRDPEMYPEPEEFRPDRFLKDGKPNLDVRDPDVAFGYGRRVCPGQFIATRTLWANVSSVLSVFDISSPLDEVGKPVQLQANMADGLISYPLPFKCIIKPRSDTAASLILSVDAI